MNETLTWEEIKRKYPHTYVGLTNIIYGPNNASVNKATVSYTDKDTSIDKLYLMYIKGDIKLRYTTLDEDELEGVIQ